MTSRKRCVVSESKAFVPQLVAEFTNIVRVIRDIQISVKQAGSSYGFNKLYEEKLRFKKEREKLFSKKYAAMHEFVEDIEHLKKVDPKNIEVYDYALQIIKEHTRMVSTETCQHGNARKLLKNLISTEIPNYFDMRYTKLSYVLDQPLANHTLRRTFHLKFQKRLAVDIKPRRNIKMVCHSQDCEDSEGRREIPHALQMEVAGSDKKFKISLDPAGSINSLQLICHLDDDHLPIVPPIYIDIPENYPFSSPTCIIKENDYSETPFLKTVLSNLKETLARAPKLYSVTHILNFWEMAVRKACCFQKTKVDSFSMAFEMLM